MPGHGAEEAGEPPDPALEPLEPAPDEDIEGPEVSEGGSNDALRKKAEQLCAAVVLAVVCAGTFATPSLTEAGEADDPLLCAAVLLTGLSIGPCWILIMECGRDAEEALEEIQKDDGAPEEESGEGTDEAQNALRTSFIGELQELSELSEEEKVVTGVTILVALLLVFFLVFALIITGLVLVSGHGAQNEFLNRCSAAVLLLWFVVWCVIAPSLPSHLHDPC